MNKRLIFIFTCVLAIFLSSFLGCYSAKYDHGTTRKLEDLQKQIFELQQDQAYINTKIDQVLADIAPLYERIGIQEKEMQEILEKYDADNKNIETEKGKLLLQKPEYSNDEEANELSPLPEESMGISSSPQKVYDKALELINSNKIDSAIPLLYKYLELFPRTELADNARYWLGECYYKQKDYYKAIQEFKKILVDYPKGNKIPDALLKTGYAYYELKLTSQALESLQKIVRLYPNDPTYSLAQKKIDLILLERGFNE